MYLIYERQIIKCHLEFRPGQFTDAEIGTALERDIKNRKAARLDAIHLGIRKTQNFTEILSTL